MIVVVVASIDFNLFASKIMIQKFKFMHDVIV